MKNKIFSILFIFLLIVLLFTSNAFASSDVKCPSCDTVLHSDLDYDLSCITKDDNKHLGLIIGLDYKNEKYVVAYWSYDSNYHNSKPFLDERSENVVCVDVAWNINIYKVVDGVLVYQGSDGGVYEKNGFRDLGKNSTVFSSTADIYTDSTKSKVFFHIPPATLEEIMRVEAGKKATIQEILGVLPLILVVVVSFLGLRKALNWLLTLLRRS